MTKELLEKEVSKLKKVKREMTKLNKTKEEIDEILKEDFKEIYSYGLENGIF